MKRHYTAIFQPEKVGYSVWLNDVRGVISQGDSLDEAIANIKDALALCIGGKKCIKKHFHKN